MMSPSLLRNQVTGGKHVVHDAAALQFGTTSLDLYKQTRHQGETPSHPSTDKGILDKQFTGHSRGSPMSLGHPVNIT